MKTMQTTKSNQIAVEVSNSLVNVYKKNKKMRAYHDTKKRWHIFLQPSSEELNHVIELLALNPDIRPRWEVIDFITEKRFLFSVEGWGHQDLLDFYYKNHGDINRVVQGDKEA
jgi:hypothetical protein